MDTHTGELLALADYPTFDANQPSLSAKGDLGSRALRDVYEPGSVEKVLTASSLIDAGKVTPHTKITVPAELPRGDRVIHDYFEHGTLHLTLTGVIAKSSNIGTVLAASAVQARASSTTTSRKFGLGQRTGIGVHGETPGVLPDWHDWSQINQDTIAFGQGLAVNAVQMAAAVNAVANGGVYVKPEPGQGRGDHLRRRRRRLRHHAPRTGWSAPAAARLTAQMMESVTNPETGTAAGAGIEGYRVAGKTGTAQRVGEKCGCYDGTFTVSFAGFAPADKPRFTGLRRGAGPEERRRRRHRSAARRSSKIMSYVLQKYAVPPTGSDAPTPRIEW